MVRRRPSRSSGIDHRRVHGLEWRAGDDAVSGPIPGEIAGGGSIRITERVAQLSGAATLPAHRRRGVQSALLRARLHDASRQGCDLAVVTTEPGSKSQANVQRVGFALLYARAVLIRRPRPTAT